MLELAARCIGGLCSRALRFPGGKTLEELVLASALGAASSPGAAAGLVPAPWPFGLAFVAAPGAGRDEVAVPGDLGGQVGGELVKERRGKSIRSR